SRLTTQFPYSPRTPRRRRLRNGKQCRRRGSSATGRGTGTTEGAFRCETHAFRGPQIKGIKGVSRPRFRPEKSADQRRDPRQYLGDWCRIPLALHRLTRTLSADSCAASSAPDQNAAKRSPESLRGSVHE